MKSQKREVDKDIDIGLPLQLGDSSYWSLTSDINADAQTVFQDFRALFDLDACGSVHELHSTIGYFISLNTSLCQVR